MAIGNVARGNNKNEIRERHREKGKKWSENGKKNSCTKKKARRPSYNWSTVPPESLLPEAVDELPNEPNLLLQFIHNTLRGA